MRKDIYERIQIMKKDNIKPNFSEMARIYNCDYRTIKKYYEGDYQKPLERKKKPSKLDPYKEIIKEKLEIPCSYQAIYYYIVKRGYKGKYTILRDFCNQYKAEKTKESTIRFETSPGLQAQVDWKENMKLYSKHGEEFVINIFLTLLGYSRLKYIELTLDKSQDTLEKCLINSFKYYGGVPEEIIFDNMKTVVDHSRSNYHEAVINESFYQFSKDMGFKVWTCRAFRPETKGKVENLAKIMERLRVFNNEFSTIEELEKIVKQLNTDLNNEISQATNEKPFERFKKEKKYLRPIPNEDVINGYLNLTDLTRIVSKESLITYNNRKYSVNPKYIGKVVSLTITNNILYIYFNKELINKHEITNKKINYAEQDYIDIIKSSVMRYSSDEEITKIAKKNLKLYDDL